MCVKIKQLQHSLFLRRWILLQAIITQLSSQIDGGREIGVFVLFQN